MRDFRDSKVMAQTLRAALAARGHKLSIGESLELTARAFGAPDWNTLAAAIKAAAPASAAPSRGRPFSAGLVRSLHRSVELATARNRGFNTPEHLLLAMLDEADVAEALLACGADLVKLRDSVNSYLDREFGPPAAANSPPPVPSESYHRAIQLAVMHAQSAGPREVTVAHVLVALFFARSPAVGALLEQGVEQADMVNFFAHGLRKGRGQAA
jgi:hypothetical protein